MAQRARENMRVLATQSMHRDNLGTPTKHPPMTKRVSTRRTCEAQKGSSRCHTKKQKKRTPSLSRPLPTFSALQIPEKARKKKQLGRAKTPSRPFDALVRPALAAVSPKRRRFDPVPRGWQLGNWTLPLPHLARRDSGTRFFLGKIWSHRFHPRMLQSSDLS